MKVLISAKSSAAPPLPQEGCPDNTHFGATNYRLPNPEYFLTRAPWPKASTKELESGPYSALKTKACSRGLGTKVRARTITKYKTVA